MRQQIQKFGRALSGMVMPNIGAFIAWGFVTALFIPSGWWPNTQMARLVEPWSWARWAGIRSGGSTNLRRDA